MIGWNCLIGSSFGSIFRGTYFHLRECDSSKWLQAVVNVLHFFIRLQTYDQFLREIPSIFRPNPLINLYPTIYINSLDPPHYLHFSRASAIPTPVPFPSPTIQPLLKTQSKQMSVIEILICTNIYQLLDVSLRYVDGSHDSFL